jgi:membrane-associated protease RseP (regulator of RpoE activity)
MTRRAAFVIGLLLTMPLSRASAAEDARKDERGTYLGVLCGARQAPDGTVKGGKKEAAGVVVTHVLPGSPAAHADLRKGDVLLAYDDKEIRDGDHLAQLIRDDRPQRKVKLLFQRGSAVQTTEAVLTLGPALKLSSDRKAGGETKEGPRSTVSVWAAPLESGKMKVTIEYYATGKLQTLTCEGAAADLASTVRKLPERERALVRIALQRLRKLNVAPPTVQR